MINTEDSSPYKGRLQELKDWLVGKNLDAYIVPQADPFQSEYVPAAFNRLAHLTGFQGSAGTAIVTPTAQLLLTDSRYTLQAQEEAGDRFTILNSQDQSYADYLSHTLSSQQKVAFDPSLITVLQYNALYKKLSDKEIELVPISENPIDIRWHNRPQIPCQPVYIYPDKYAGLSYAEKVSRVFDKTQANTLILTDPVSIAWLFNLRGADLPNTPVFLSYAVIHRDGTSHIFLQKSIHRLDDEECALPTHINFHELEDFPAFLDILDTTISIDPALTPYSIDQLLKDRNIIEEKNPCLLLKSLKNKTEQAGMRNCHIRDGVALTTFLYWLDTQAQAGEQHTEYDLSQKLDGLRANLELFKGLSFPTISASGPNGAMAHYRVEKETARLLQQGDIYLVDSGGQYWDGTTDVTRTILYGGTPEPAHIEMYTRVLKGHIGIAQLVFPKKITGAHIDVLARQHLWDIYKDYGHGTGHGVGHFLNVHEAPPSITLRPGGAPFDVGMVVSNEPAYYENGHYGIRLENLIMVQQAGDPDAQYLKFDTLTCAPFDKRLIDKALLTADELQWLNAYHQWVFESLAPYFNGQPDMLAWLEESCSVISS